MLRVFLPYELITEVLSFLPVRSLIRLKCVCKSWKTLISNPMFVKLHLKRSARNKHIAIFSNEYKKCSNIKISHFPMHRLLEKTSLTIANDPCFDDDHGSIYLLGSYDGLLCLLTINNDEYSLYLWNPATRSLSIEIKFVHCDTVYPFVYGWNCGFGYDNSTGTYKIVSLCRSCKEVRVLSIGDSVWRNIQSFPDAYKCTGLSGVYVNGSLNWLTIPKQSPHEDGKTITINQFVIISLDLSTETYRQFLPPRVFDDKVPLVWPKIAVLMDSLCYSHDFNGTDLIIWQMKKFGVQESWIQFLKISYHSLPIVFDVFFGSVLFPLYLSENGDTLILAWSKGEQAILYNLRDNSVEKTRITNNVRMCFSKDYVESLVSFDDLQFMPTLSC